MQIFICFNVCGIILGVKHDADFKNSVCKQISARLGVVFVGFNVNGVVILRRILFFSARVMLGIGIEKYADYEDLFA